MARCPVTLRVFNSFFRDIEGIIKTLSEEGKTMKKFVLMFVIVGLLFSSMLFAAGSVTSKKDKHGNKVSAYTMSWTGDVSSGLVPPNITGGRRFVSGGITLLVTGTTAAGATGDIIIYVVDK